VNTVERNVAARISEYIWMIQINNTEHVHAALLLFFSPLDDKDQEVSAISILPPYPALQQ